MCCKSCASKERVKNGKVRGKHLGKALQVKHNYSTWLLVGVIEKPYRLLKNRLLERYPNAVFVTDDYGAYKQELNPQRHLIGKDLTYSLEQHNSDSRYYIARFRRKSKVITHQENRIVKFLWLTEGLTRQGGLESLRQGLLSI